MDRVIIFDTTLRDGEQAPGAAIGFAARLRLARMIAAAGADVIEAGFPATSPQVAKSVVAIARAVHGARVAALARCVRSDIDTAWEAVRHAEEPRIHTFLATSDVHLESKLRMTRERALELVAENVSHARSRCSDVEFSAEDATRSDIDYLAKVFSTAIAAGATTLNAPDTVGFTTPDEYAAMIRALIERVEGIEKATLSVHTHDDLGLATANALAAIRAGARQVECTINGIGERAGNCSLEEVVVSLRVRPDHFGCEARFDTRAIQEISRAVARATRMPVQKNKAIVGANAFAHESGIHQDGMLKNRATYEFFDPAIVGVRTTLPLGRNSGRHALFHRAAELGFAFEGAARARFEQAFRALAEERPTVSDEDLRRLAQSVARGVDDERIVMVS
jgi:2-isopropylmalate synthase